MAGKIDEDNSIVVGKYVIINRKKFNKVVLLTDNCVVQLGKDKVHLAGINGHPFWSTFKMIPKNSKREFTLTLCCHKEISDSSDLLKIKTSGVDNRNIWDDGSSQKLTTEKIIELRDSGISSQAIVGHLIENSKTFHNKTEFSQEKYLKKKGTKYFEYITIKKPTIRILCELFFSKNPSMILGLRIDSLSQIVTSINLQPDGKYILYENGSQGLVAATILNYLSEKGKLVYISPGKHPQKHAVLAMNFNEKLEQMKCIQLSTLLEKLENINVTNATENISIKETIVNEINNSNDKLNENEEIKIEIDAEVKTENDFHNGETMDNSKTSKRKHEQDSDDLNMAKKPRWKIYEEDAFELLNLNNNDGLIIVCKEYPLNLLKKLITFIGPSRPFVVFNFYRELLAELYKDLKLRHDVVNLRLTETWLRSYQVLPERTHPDVLMNGNSGYLLTGTIVKLT